MIYDPIHHLFLKMQATVNNTAHDLATAREEKAQALGQVAAVRAALDVQTAAMVSAETERDALKQESASLRAENESLKKPTPSSTTPPSPAKVVVGTGDHL